MKKIFPPGILLILMISLVTILCFAFFSCGGSGDREHTILKKDSVIKGSSANPVTNNDGKSDTPSEVKIDSNQNISASEHNNKVSPKPEIQKAKEIIHATDNNFDETIKSGVVLVDFWATWCGPCRQQSPILEEVNKEMAGKITIAKLNIDENRTTTKRFGVMNIPTLLIFKNGVQVNKFVGLTEKDEIINALNKVLK